jgi:hypothetical protein
MSASVSFKDVEAMLTKCAKGSTWRLATHFRIVKYNKKVFRALPKHDSIELGHIRKMIRYLGIDKDCAKTVLPI